MRTRVKICGITRVEDALCAVQHGADAIGLVFYAQSPRFVTMEAAREIVAALPPLVSVVGLFVNATKAEIDKVLTQVRLDILQFHGDESAADCVLQLPERRRELDPQFAGFAALRRAKTLAGIASASALSSATTVAVRRASGCSTRYGLNGMSPFSISSAVLSEPS